MAARTRSSPAKRRALVLGGGGISGIAWKAGVLQGLKDGGFDVGRWDLVVGTSAGSYVGARLLLAGGPEKAYAEEIDCDLADDELELAGLTGSTFVHSLRLGRRRRLTGIPGFWFLGVFVLTLVRHAARHGIRRTLAVWRTMRHPDFDPARVHVFGKAIGSIALIGRRGSDAALLAYLTRMLGSGATWPSSHFMTVAADVATGHREPLDAGSGVSIVQAVAASMALPGFVLPIDVGGRHLMDGGVTSSTSADLARGFDEVLVIAPLVSAGVIVEIEQLRATGTRVDLIRPSPAGAARWSGMRMMDPKERPDAARAGREDGRAAARELGSTEVDAEIEATA